jgi:hypothetical protein
VTETTLTARIVKMLRARGAYVNKNHGSRYQPRGRPDIEFCLDGRFWAFEVKLPGKQLTPMQHRTFTEIRDAGGRAFVVRSVEDASLLVRDCG